MNAYTLVITVANTTLLVTSCLLVRVAYRAFERTNTPALRTVTMGVGFVAVGTFLGGVTHLAVGTPLAGIAAQLTFVAGGFVLLVYSLYVKPTARTTVTRCVR